MTFGVSGGPYTMTRPGGMRAARPGVHVEIDDHGLIAELQAAPAETKRLLRIGFWQAAQILRRRIVDGIRKPPKTGRWYKRTKGKKGVMHRASAPGEWPAADTGNLMRGIQQNRVSDSAFAVDVVSTARQSAPLEYKPPERGGRPFMSRGFDESVDEVLAMVRMTLAQIFPANRIARRK